MKKTKKEMAPQEIASKLESEFIKMEKKERRAISMGAIVSMFFTAEAAKENSEVIKILKKKFEIGRVPPGTRPDEADENLLYIWRPIKK